MLLLSQTFAEQHDGELRRIAPDLPRALVGDDGAGENLEAVRAAWESRENEEADPEPVATIQASQGLPYPTIHLVMRNAGYAGCYRFRLVVEKQ